MPEQLHSYTYANTLPQFEQDWGVAIHELEPAERQTRSFGEVCADNAEILAAAKAYISSGAVEVKDPTEPGPSDVVTVHLTSADIAPQPGLSEIIGDRKHISPELAEKAGLSSLFRDKEREAVTNYTVQKVARNMDHEYGSLQKELLESATRVSQVFEVKGRDGAGFKIMNFSDTLLEGQTLRKVMNALREMDQLTGGKSTKRLQLLAIFPQDTPRWHKVGEAVASIGAKGIAGITQGNGVISLNEGLLKAQSKEDAERRESLTVNGGDIEITMFHELTHLVEGELKNIKDAVLPSEKFGWEHAREHGYLNLQSSPIFNGETKSPSPYGQTDPAEDVAEAGAAMFAGGKWAGELDDKRKQALVDMYEDVHTGLEGPAYLTCNEIPLKDITPASKYGLKLEASTTIKPVVSYDIDAIW